MRFDAPVVIFEGPDGAGKSGLAYAVARKLNAVRVACGPPPPGRAVHTFMNALAIAERGVPTVVDRLHWGDLVYAPKYRPDVGSEFNEESTMSFNLQLARAGALWVTVVADPEVLLARHHEREEIAAFIEVSEPELRRQWTEYLRLTSSLGVTLRDHGLAHRGAFIDTTPGFDTFDQLVDDIVTRAQQ